MKKNKVLVLGVGNVILSDEGVGVHVVRRLQSENIPENVELLDAGTWGLDLLDGIEEVARLIIVDCVKGGGEPGAIYKFEPDSVDIIPKQYKISFHDLGIYDFLRLAKMLGDLPPTIIYGMEPKNIDWGENLSPAIEVKLDKLKDFVLEEIRSSVLMIQAN
jgi:hydrogenase maturation protease